ncbi:MAG: hypothetical protein E7292_11425 [Lachnospiraceae bacterium]|nr:hypothetical protein [Lachnospiraceae bacterium]
MGKEVVKGTDTGGITDRETTEDSIKRSFPEHAAPLGNGSNFKLQSKQIRAQHAGRKPWFRTKEGITFLHNGIGKGKIKIPELDNVIPGTLRKRERVRIKFQEIRYEGILIGGMTAGVIR